MRYCFLIVRMFIDIEWIKFLVVLIINISTFSLLQKLIDVLFSWIRRFIEVLLIKFPLCVKKKQFVACLPFSKDLSSTMKSTVIKISHITH